MRLTAVTSVFLLLVPFSAFAADLTFEQRVDAQGAIERVYYEYQRGASRPFDRALPRELLEDKVSTYLEQSAALEELGRLTVTAEVLRRELERIAAGTHFPDRLLEIYAALDHDSVLIQETLARSSLVRRRAAALADDAEWKRWNEEASSRTSRLWIRDVATPLDVLPLPGHDATRGLLRGAGPCPTDEMWDNGVLDYQDLQKGFQELTLPFWTGDSILLLRQRGDYLARYDMDLDSWSEFPNPLALEERQAFSAVWTGNELIIWGGNVWGAPNAEFDTGFRFDPLTNGWTAVSTVNAPSERRAHSAVWTGDRMIVYGGAENNFVRRNGASYDPLTDTWTTIFNPVGSGRSGHHAIWTGSEMIIWGGYVLGELSNSGERYDPATGNWSYISSVGAPSPRHDTDTAEVGGELIVWGGMDDAGPLAPLGDGARYDPVADTWTPIASGPTPRWGHRAVSTGTEMVIWGGYAAGNQPTDEHARYDPVADAWSLLPQAGAPRATYPPVWGGDALLMWDDNVGKRYSPATDSWAEFGGVANAPRMSKQSVWTGTEMIVWSGDSDEAGGRYDPLLDAWFPVSSHGAPVTYSGGSGSLASAVWTGDEMIVWGGWNESGHATVNTGARYDPARDRWTPTPTFQAPLPRDGHTAVWTGSEMVVWGGWVFGVGRTQTGGRYDPLSNLWTPTSTVNAPEARDEHLAVWSGSEMIVWGGTGAVKLSSGGRYDPATDSWSATSLVGAPDARANPSAIWTGTEMVIWGGSISPTRLDTGGRYDPASDSWQPTDTLGATAASGHGAIWTGTEMLV